MLGAPFDDVSFQGDQNRGFGFVHDGPADPSSASWEPTAFVRAESNLGGIRSKVYATRRAPVPTSAT